MASITNYLHPKLDEILQNEILSYVYQKNSMIPIEYYLSKPPPVLFYTIKYIEEIDCSDHSYEVMLKSYIDNNEIISYKFQNSRYSYALKNLVFHSCISKDVFYYANIGSEFLIDSFGISHKYANQLLKISENLNNISNQSNSMPAYLLLDHIWAISDNRKFSPIVLIYALNTE